MRRLVLLSALPLLSVLLPAPVTAQRRSPDSGLGSLAAIVSTTQARSDDGSFFSRLIGTWDVEQTRRDENGWQAAPDPAVWIWTATLGGSAIQDYWIAPPGHEVAGWQGQMGTNLRIFDSEAGVWRIVWTANNETGFTDYEATDHGDRVVMLGRHPSSGDESRITYTMLDEDTLDWLLEFRRGSDWLAVSRVRATRRGR